MSPAGLDAIAESLQAHALTWSTIKVENPTLSVARCQEVLLEAGMDLQAETLETLIRPCIDSSCHLVRI